MDYAKNNNNNLINDCSAPLPAASVLNYPTNSTSANRIQRNISNFKKKVKKEEISTDPLIINKNKIKKQKKEVDFNQKLIEAEFYKIGKKCEGLKKRYAIISKGRLLSSTYPLSKFKMNHTKDKSENLKGCVYFTETFDKTNKEKGMGVWSNKDKKFRLRINYRDEEFNRCSSYFIYFYDENEVNEVVNLLFGY